MERKTFLKNIFGAVVVADMPPILVRQIEKLPPEKIIPKVIPKANRIFSSNFLYLHDGKNLVGASVSFNITMYRELMQIPMSIDDDGSIFTEYKLLPWEWSVQANELQWFGKDTEIRFIEDSKSLYSLIYYEGKKIIGEVFMVQWEQGLESVPYTTEFIIRENALFRGTNALIFEDAYENGENTRITEQLRAAEGREE